MGKIAILNDILCNQIAAGEVVERPAAVVKELVENSIDAGSSKITVSLLQGGRKEIRVVDNGCGMGPDDALLAIERHATSKIRSSEDLQSILTLGFRGEALPSIASVSRFELVTREHDALSGTQIKIEGGVLRDVREKGCPPGTQVVVRDLFHNVPGRRKFMRTAETELAYITDQFLRTSLSRPEIHLQLVSQDRVLHDFPTASNTSQRVGQALGRDVLVSLGPLDFEKDGIKVSGCLASPQVQRTNSQSLFLFVNGRPVWDRLLQRTVLTAYEALIPRGKYPVALLFIELPPSGVDVNVHPAKREVRFKNPGEVLPVVREALMSALASSRPRVLSIAPGETPFFTKRDAPLQPGFFRERQAPFNSQISAEPVGALDAEPARTYPQISVQDNSGPDCGAPDAPPDFSFSALPVIGVFANAFILLEARDGLILIDQHAAHERILFNDLSAGPSRASAQLLTRPALVHLMPKEAAALKKLLKGLESLGFEIEPFGGGSFAVHALPAPIASIPADEVIRDLLKSSGDGLLSTESGLMQSLVKIASCRGAVKAGQKLKGEEIRHLLESLDRTECPFTCPHGRPLWIKITHDHILRLFKRT
ncbi:MAG: DNA mismatch repair endonuclease MutL [Syntrophobacteraceae bacterium]